MGPSINDVTHGGGRGVSEIVTVYDKGREGGNKKCDITYFS